MFVQLSIQIKVSDYAELPPLKPGIYDFTVVSARESDNGDAVWLSIGINGHCYVDRFPLTENMRWKFAQFFKAVGVNPCIQIKAIMNMGGRTGRVNVEPKPDDSIKYIRYQYITPESDERMILLRNYALQRDHFSCAVCGRFGTHMHHRHGKAKFPELAYDPDNVVILCEEHHMKTAHGQDPEEYRHDS